MEIYIVGCVGRLSGSWSSGYDIALTQRRSPVRIRSSPLVFHFGSCYSGLVRADVRQALMAFSRDCIERTDRGAHSSDVSIPSGRVGGPPIRRGSNRSLVAVAAFTLSRMTQSPVRASSNISRPRSSGLGSERRSPRSILCRKRRRPISESQRAIFSGGSF